MKKIFITTLLFLMALCALAAPDTDIAALLRYGPVDLAYGFTPPAVEKLSDLSTVTVADPTSFITNLSDPMPAYQMYSDWYSADFSKDPFDGKIEVLVMGEPLPSPAVTILVALGTLMIIMWSRKQPKRA